MFSKVIFLLALVVAANSININRYQHQFQQMIANQAGKIVGGTEATPHFWPWQIEMRTSSGSFICGGSILSDRWIMTAAHCCEVYAASPSNYRVRVGVHQRSSNSEGAVLMTLSKVVVHPSYDAEMINNDYCLLKTSKAISFTTKVFAVSLPTISDGPVGKQCWATGWGHTKGGGTVTDKLRQTNVDIISNTDCYDVYGEIIMSNVVCAIAPGHGICQGDSGGPLVCYDDANEYYKLVGVSSFTATGCDPQYPGAFARVSSVLSWIASTMAT